MMKSSNTTINIPEKFYLGLYPMSNSLPQGYMVPWGTTKVFTNRMARVDSWGSTRNRVILDNSPSSGFRISRAQRNRGWNSSIETINIEDPRGFEVPVSIVNLIMLSGTSVIQDGEILQECVWGLDGANIILLPVNSEPYLEAQKNTDRMSTKVSIRKVKLGDRVMTTNAVEGIYLGSYHLNTFTSNYTTGDRSQCFLSSNSKIMVIQTEPPNGDKPGTYKGSTAFKISSIVEEAKTAMDEIECEKLVNANLGQISLGNTRSYYARKISMTTQKPDNIKIEFHDTTSQELDEAYQAIKNHKRNDRDIQRAFWFVNESSVIAMGIDYSPYNTSRYLGYRNQFASDSWVGNPVSKDHLLLGAIMDSGGQVEVKKVNEPEFKFASISYENTKTGMKDKFFL